MFKPLSAAVVALSLVAVAQPASAQMNPKTFLAQIKAQQAAQQAKIQAEMKALQAKIDAEKARMQAELQAAEKAAAGN